MPFVPQTVELTSRLRTAFGVRGSLSISVDEVAVPTVSLFDATRAPFRLNGMGFWGTLTQQGAVGGFSKIGVLPQDDRTVLIVDRISFWASAVSFFNLQFEVFAPVGPATLFVPELLPQPGAAIANGAGSLGGSLPAVAPLGSFFNSPVAANVTQTIDLGGMMIPKGARLFGYLADANVTLNMSVQGRFFVSP